MYAGFNTIDDLNVEDKAVLLRIDADVPLKDGKVQDDSRLRAAIPTIKDLQAKGARVVIMGHLGRPDGQVKGEFTLRPVAERLSKLLKQDVRFVVDCVGRSAENAVNELQKGDVALLENLRFHYGEQRNEDVFSKGLAKLANAYVCDAFANAHRDHASMVGVLKFIKQCAIGRQIEKEIATLETVLDNPKKPLLVIIGGSKISTKIGVLRNLMPKAEQIIIGGAMANTFLVARGFNVGQSLFEPGYVDVARDILSEAGGTGCRLLLPSDVVVAKEFKEGAEAKSIPIAEIASNDIALDIGENTTHTWTNIIVPKAGTILWNGPVGAFETKPFDKSTVALAKAIAECDAFKVGGGGDTLSAIATAGVSNKFDYLSTAGGALLEFLEGKELAALAALKKKTAA